MPYLPEEVLFLGQVFGALPLDYATKPRSPIVLFSPKLFKWGLFVVMIQSVCSLLVLYLDFESRYSSRPIRIQSNTSLMAVLLDEATLIILAVVVLSGSSKNVPNLVELHRILARFDGSLQLNAAHSNALLKVAVVLAFITALLLVTTVLFLDERCIFLLYVPGFTVFYTQATLFLHFTEVCSCIANRFRIINSRIKGELIKWNSTGYDKWQLGVNFVKGTAFNVNL
ncbi:hypothetical protein J6590_054629 [Homalodisca vitripennis]|nr:hypothetical protein J6590_054629 [Homalodisca vitripennis]